MKKGMLKLIACSAFLITLCNVNQACMFWANQPRIPETAKKLRKF